jgi:hypothetical protein
MSAPEFAVPSADSVLVVADGPSAQAMRVARVPESVHVLAVNSAVKWLPRVDGFFTLDPSARNRWLMRNQRRGVEYFAAIPSNYGTPTAHPHHRPPIEPNVTFFERVSGPGPFGSAPGMCPWAHGINTGNSAWGALGLAVKMEPRKIGLIGVDGTQEPRVSGGTPSTLSHLPWLFSTYDGAPEVRNGNRNSAVTCFQSMPLGGLLEWLAQ